MVGEVRMQTQIVFSNDGWYWFGIALRGVDGMIYFGTLGPWDPGTLGLRGSGGKVGDLLAGLPSKRVARFKGFWLRRKFYSAPSG